MISSGDTLIQLLVVNIYLDFDLKLHQIYLYFNRVLLDVDNKMSPYPQYNHLLVAVQVFAGDILSYLIKLKST